MSILNNLTHDGIMIRASMSHKGKYTAFIGVDNPRLIGEKYASPESALNAARNKIEAESEQESNYCPTCDLEIENTRYFCSSECKQADNEMQRADDYASDY